jgi:small subunit ribosomal protein S2
MINGGGINQKGECMTYLSMKELLEAGVHFGHQTKDGTRK